MTEDARNSDPDTSHEAAESIQESKESMMRQMMEAYTDYSDNTAYEAMQKLPGKGGSCPWHRVGDCRKAGYLYRTGEKRPGATNRKQHVLAITPEGEKWMGLT